MCRLRNYILCTVWICHLSYSWAQNANPCSIPEKFRGQWFSYEGGDQIFTQVDEKMVDNRFHPKGSCVETVVTEDSNQLDSDRTGFSMKIVIRVGTTRNYFCLDMLLQTLNVIQTRKTGPVTILRDPSMDIVCREVTNAQLTTMFRNDPLPVSCKNTFEGYYHFSYQLSEGGGGVCDKPGSIIDACQNVGTELIDNYVFDMFWAHCAELPGLPSKGQRFHCLGSWRDESGTIWASVADNGETVSVEKFKCLMTRDDQQEINNRRRWVMSNTPVCHTLVDLYKGPFRLTITPTLTPAQRIKPSCNLPRDFSGVWFHTGEYDSDVTINSTHMVWLTKASEYHTRETVYACQQQAAGRILMSAFIKGHCEQDYICFDFLPRKHNVIRFRMSKPFSLQGSRTSSVSPDIIFRQSCHWSAFTHNREDPDFMYQTLILNPPTPVRCPIRGRYTFQYGQNRETFKTRFPGITERPWMQVLCQDPESDFAACRNHEDIINVDSERCVTVDHIGKPIGEYDFPDHRLQCAGYWMEDYRSFLITYDEEDPMSKFRCWVYERKGVRSIAISRAFRARCGSAQTATSLNVSEGVSLQLMLRENEYIHDDCPQGFNDGRVASSENSALTNLYFMVQGNSCHSIFASSFITSVALLFTFSRIF